MEKCRILTVNVDVTNMEEVLAHILNNLEKLKGEYICVANVHTTVMAYENKEFNIIQNSSAMVLPDGKPLSILSKLKGFKSAQRVTGPDLMGRIIETSHTRELTHYLYGSTKETLEALKSNLLKEHPSLNIVGMYSPPFRKLSNEEDEEIVKLLNEAKADFLWVGLGAPKQEIWMYEHKNKVNSIMIGVGAAFDYYAGNIKRAPKILQDLSLEWVYRLCQDPRRLFKRYVSTNSKFLIYCILDKLRNKRF